MRLPYFLGLVLLCSMTGCQIREREKPRMAVLRVASEAPGSCRLTIDGNSFSFPDEEQRLIAALRLKATTYSGATIEADKSIPYKCFGGAIVLAQRAGFKRVGFIAEPPPPTTN